MIFIEHCEFCLGFCNFLHGFLDACFFFKKRNETNGKFSFFLAFQ